MLPLLELGGMGPVLHWAPANGFPFSTYQPIIDGLSTRYRSVAVPPRALRPDAGPPPERFGRWHELADDILAGLDDHRLTGVIGVGHSFGGVATIIAAAREPARFRGLVLLDPTMLPPERTAALVADQRNGWRIGHPLAAKSRTRRDQFDSPDEAFAYWRGKGLFGDWSDAALRRYVDGMVVPDGAGRFRLAWPAAWESYYYESIHLDPWTELRALPPELPVLALGGGTTDTFVAASLDLFRAMAPGATVDTIPGYGHLFPQAAPEATLARIRGWLQDSFG